MVYRKTHAEGCRPKIIFLAGPTAIGKSALAVRLAKKINAEIISCDSMQIYKGLNVLSSKPPQNLQKQIRHHLLDVVPPEEEFSAACYRKLAIKAIKDIHARGKIPLFVGGTGLYMSVVIDGIFKDVGKDDVLRNRLYKLGERYGSLYLYNRLKVIDKAAARKIHPNDLKRIIRALEVFNLTGKPISELQKKKRSLSNNYDIIIFGLNKSREDLYDDINKRVDEMFNRGAVCEVKRLIGKSLSLTCRQAIGINEIRLYLKGEYGEEDARELIKKSTRNYAKRQLTWFRKDKRIIWFDAAKKNILKDIMNRIERNVGGAGV